MWPGFDGRGYDRDQWLAHVAETPLFPGSLGVTEHATGIPTLAQALAMDESKYIVNTQRYYENSLRWSHGPHVFASHKLIWGFSSLSVRGTHCSCDNLRGFFGVEAMGNRNTEDFSSGAGALVLENQHFAIAALFVKMGRKPDPTNYLPHSHCAADGHFQCPKENWERDCREAETAAIVGFMNAIGDKLVPNPAKAAQAVSLYPTGTAPVFGSTGWVQTALDNWLVSLPSAPVRITIDGDNGPATAGALRAFQTVHDLDDDGLAGPQTCAALHFYMP